MRAAMVISIGVRLGGGRNWSMDTDCGGASPSARVGSKAAGTWVCGWDGYWVWPGCAWPGYGWPGYGWPGTGWAAWGGCWPGWFPGCGFHPDGAAPEPCGGGAPGH